ncbi:MAG: hypothetical protein R2707_03620 [Acidimicrobiales bacterium]
MKNTLRTIALLLTMAVLFASCGGGDDTESDGSDSPVVDDSSQPDTTDPDPTTAPDDEVDAPTEPAGGGTLEIVLDDGRSWSFEQYKCNYSPDNEGAFVELWGAGATVPTGGDFSVLMATPADPAKTENLLSGVFIDDANDILFPIVEGEAVSDGTTMTMTLGMYRDGLRAVGDPIDFIATVTCSL